MKTFSEGDRVLVSVGLGGSKPGAVDRDFDGTGKVHVVLDEKTKARPFLASKVRLAEKPRAVAKPIKSSARTVRRRQIDEERGDVITPSDAFGPGRSPVAEAEPEPRHAIAPPPIDPSRRSLAKPPLPARDEAYLTWVRMHPCAACQGRKDMEAHHWAPKRGAGQKVSDYFTVPLCVRCHRHFHDTGHVPCFRDAKDPAQATRQLFAEREAGLLEKWISQRARRARGGVS